MKGLYVKAVRDTYGKSGKPARNESFENYILVIADLVSGVLFTLSILCIISTGILIYLHGLTRGPLAMFIIYVIIFFSVAIKSSRVSKIKLTTTIKLIKLRLKMSVFMISPP